MADAFAITAAYAAPGIPWAGIQIMLSTRSNGAADDHGPYLQPGALANLKSQIKIKGFNSHQEGGQGDGRQERLHHGLKRLTQKHGKRGPAKYASPTRVGRVSARVIVHICRHRPWAASGPSCSIAFSTNG